MFMVFSIGLFVLVLHIHATSLVKFIALFIVIFIHAKTKGKRDYIIIVHWSFCIFQRKSYFCTRSRTTYWVRNTCRTYPSISRQSNDSLLKSKWNVVNSSLLKSSIHHIFIFLPFQEVEIYSLTYKSLLCSF